MQAMVKVKATVEMATMEAISRDLTIRTTSETRIKSTKPRYADTLCNQAHVQSVTHAPLLMVNRNSVTCKM